MADNLNNGNNNNAFDDYEASNATAWIITAIVVIAIILGAWWLIERSKNASPVVGDTGTSTPIDEASSTGTVTAAGTNEAAAGTGVSASSATSANSTGSTAAASAPQATASSNGDSVSAASQPAGSSVKVNMNLSQNSWVAIKDSGANGWTLGAAWFPAGATSGTVALERATVAGKSYVAEIYVDDGTKTFKLHAEKMVVGSDGNPVMATFSAQ